MKCTLKGSSKGEKKATLSEQENLNLVPRQFRSVQCAALHRREHSAICECALADRGAAESSQPHADGGRTAWRLRTLMRASWLAQIGWLCPDPGWRDHGFRIAPDCSPNQDIPLTKICSLVQMELRCLFTPSHANLSDVKRSARTRFSRCAGLGAHV
jgi:hypothetical protein